MSFNLATFFELFAVFGDILLTWGWLLIVILALGIAWELYMLIKRIDYVSAIQFTFLQITVPEDSPFTPKSMEQAFEVWGGIHKDPDLIEQYFEGYSLAWYSCELQCSRNKMRFIMVVPTPHRKFFEGVIYGQYPSAEIQEVEDYSQEFSHYDLEKTFDLFGSEVILAKDDFYPIRTYQEYEDSLAEDDRYIDPLQSVIEAFTNVEAGEHFWFQLLVRPVSAKVISKWADKGLEQIAKLSGREKKETAGIMTLFFGFFLNLPGEVLRTMLGNTGEDKEEKRTERFFITPSEQEESKGILMKVSRNAFKTRMRLLHIAPAGKLHKPNVSKAFGAFKQFNTNHLNSLKPDPDTKTNGPGFILKQTRRNYRKRAVLINYQSRDFWGEDSGYMMNAEELATLFHFPSKYSRSPSIPRATSGLGSAPENLPYI